MTTGAIMNEDGGSFRGIISDKNLFSSRSPFMLVEVYPVKTHV